MAKKF